MDIGYILIMIIIWGLVLLFGSVLGAVVGAVLEGLFGFRLMFYVGFIFGIIALALYVGQFLFGDGEDYKPPTRSPSPFTVIRRVRMAKRMLKMK